VKDTNVVTLDFALQLTTASLDQVVTTATGKQRRMEVGSDITILDVDSILKIAPITSVTNLLEGRVPGLTVVHSTGTPGDPSRLRLRGAASIEGSNDPIVIIDGVRMYYASSNANGAQSSTLATGQSYPRPSPLDQIDPNSIETIEVFKGPSASAMYGSDAANGVIVITTKRGRAGKTHWNYSANGNISSIPGSYPRIAYSFGHLLTGNSSSLMACDAGISAVGPCVVDSTVYFQALNDSRFSPLTRGGGGGTSLSVSGGASNLTYSLTGSLSGTRGMVKLPKIAREQYERFSGTTPPAWMTHPDGYRTWGIDGQLSSELSRNAHVTVSSRIASSDQKRSSLGLSGIGQLLGQFVDTTQLGQSVLMNAFTERATAKTGSATHMMNVDWQMRPWLSINAVGGIDQNQQTDKTFRPPGLPVQLLTNTDDTTGSFAVARQNNSVKTLGANATTAIPLSGQKELQLGFGFNAQISSSEYSMLNTHTVPIGVTEPTSFENGYQTSTSQSTYGWYFEPRFQLGSRFFFSPGIRLDGGSASGSNAGYTGFPKMSMSWVAIDPSNSEGTWYEVLSTLRLRAAYGYAGVQPGPAERLRLVTQPSVVVDGVTPQPGVAFSTQGNSLLRPERSRELELGLDAQFWDSRASLGATFYHKKRLDAIMQMRVAPSAGGGIGSGVLDGSLFYYRSENIGTINNTGIEINADAQLIQSAPVQWDVQFQLSHNTNKLLKLNQATLSGSPGGQNARLMVGYPIDGIWVRPLTGYGDANGNGVIDLNELVFSDSLSYLGTQNAPISSSFGTQVSVLNGRIAFNANFNFESGVTQYNSLGLVALRSTANAPDATLEQQAIYLATAYASKFDLSAFDLPTQYLYQTVNTLRWRSASLSYVLPASVARALHGQTLTLSLQGDNLWLHTNYRGKDPNVNALLTGEGVADFGQIPQPRVWSLRLNFTN
jgi:TonB-linked SusC/RagA family outer membrane protein